MLKNIFLIICIFVLPCLAMAQDTLPDLSVTKLGRKVLVSWKNNYTNVTHINIQRSGDSVRNFTTIGTVLNVAAPVNGFVDTKEFIPSTQYYRLFITFKGGTYIFTESKRPSPDTASIASTVVNVKKEENANQFAIDNPKIELFVPSKHVYTGNNNNVIITIPNVRKHHFSIKFYEDDGTLLFEIDRVRQSFLILDKVNFLHSGLFRFELFQDRLPIEIHKFYIPADGEQMPVLDTHGNRIK